MKKHMLILPVFLVAVVALILSMGTSAFADPPPHRTRRS